MELTPLLETVNCTAPDVFASFGTTATSWLADADITGNALPSSSTLASEIQNRIPQSQNPDLGDPFKLPPEGPVTLFVGSTKSQAGI